MFITESTCSARVGISFLDSVHEATCLLLCREIILCLLALVFANATATKPTVDLRQSPTGGKAPVDVSVGLYVTNFVAIDDFRETFEVGGFLTGHGRIPVWRYRPRNEQ